MENVEWRTSTSGAVGNALCTTHSQVRFLRKDLNRRGRGDRGDASLVLSACSAIEKNLLVAAEGRAVAFRGKVLEIFVGATGLIPNRATCWMRESRKTGESLVPYVEWSISALHSALKTNIGTEVLFT